ncbi:hypothetical protein ES705_21622 [subsurface metagenome]
MITKEQAYKTLEKLIERFDDHIDTYKKGYYNETQTRVDYINPFFKALGWDIDNEQGLAEAYREVIHEDKIKIGGTTKAPDYCFTVYGQRKFFVDAKKPAVNIKSDISPAYQVRRYGWSAKLPIAIVTDFEEFSIYDCSKKPNQNDRPSVARIQYLKYNDYLKEFDFIWETFSKERILKGSFDKFVQSDTKKRGTATVDNEFLKEIEEWRKYLATTIALRNKTLTEDEVNFAVQKIIDRILFLRICEDRGVEQYANLKNTIKKGDLYKNLFELFHIADEKYNSGLFDFKQDTITANLIIDNKVIKNIVQELYYPLSPFEFSVFPADILGSVYEQFLGKTIRLTKAHHARIEEKPEVRKAGGVYYTPKYIVDYIVENTVGKLINGKTPKQIEKIRICDPACGSGSFLIGAYQYLLDRHLKYYTDLPAPKLRQAGNPPKKKKDNPLTPDGNLTTAEKKRILLNNIFGVDIDAQATEVTKLNLLLKAMEGETQASISKQLTFFNERVLPNLRDNIKCGNSLIGNDFYDNQLDLFPDQIKKINAFNWEDAFPEIFINGGFDAVLGNPPYVRQELISENKSYFETHYQTYHGSADLYQYFVERGISLLNPKGYFSYIVANKWMRANYGSPLRTWLKQHRILEITDFGDLPVFKQATTYPCIIIAQKGPVKEDYSFDVTQMKTLEFTELGGYVEENKYQVSTGSLDYKGWNLARLDEINLLGKLNKNSIPLGEYVKGKIYRGVLTGLNEAFVIDKNTKDRLISESPKSAEVLRPFLAGRDIKRYLPPNSDNYLIFFPKGYTDDHYTGKKPWNWLEETYPAISKQLKPYENKAQKRCDKGDYWWELRSCDYYKEFDKLKIIYQVFQIKPCFTYDKIGCFSNNSIWIIPTEDKKLIAILNSKIGWFLISTYCTKIQNGYQLIFKYLEKVPITKNENPQIVKLVDNLLKLNKKLQKTKLETQRNQLQRAIDYSERKIDEMVYGLYGLSKKEIEIIENS